MRGSVYKRSVLLVSRAALLLVGCAGSAHDA